MSPCLAQDTTAVTSDEIKHYKIKSPLGAGGMGEVYLAEDTRLRRRVALKFLPSHFTSDPNHLRRFELEARAVASLSHPNVCTIHEVVETEERQLCIVMEYVNGITLRQRMAAGQMKIGDALDVAIQVAAALSAAHATGIVHRDIKPENVMLRSDGLVKVLDFGLAKLAPLNTSSSGAEAQTELLVQTNPGIVMGTVHYMSPEQARGKNVDVRTDIWSLGVVLYEMLTNHPPFTGETSSHLIVSILESEPPPLDHYVDAPADLQRIVTKALRKDKKERYQTAAEFAAEVKNLKQELEVSDRLARPAEIAIKTPNRRELLGDAPASDSVSGFFSQKRMLVVVACLALAFVIATLLFYFISQRMSGPIADQPVKSIAVLPFKSLGAGADADEYLGIGLAETLTARLSSLKLLTVRPTSAILKYASAQKETVVAGRELGVDTVLEGSIRKVGERVRVTAQLVSTRDGSLIWTENFDENFTDIFKLEDSISGQVVQALALRLSGEEQQRLTRRYTDNPEAYRLYLKGRYFWNKRTADGFKRSIEQYKQALEIDSGYALAYAGLADSYKGLAFYNFAAPNETMPQAKEAALHAIALNNKLAEPHASLAHVLTNYDWNWSEAEKEFKLSIELNPDYATAHQWYAIHYLTAKRRWEEALQEMKTALELEPTSLVMNSFMGATLHYAGRTDEAIDQLRKTIELDPNFAVAHWYLGLAYEQKKMFGEAVAEFQQAVTLSGGSPLMKAALAHAYAKTNRKAEAIAILNELQELSKSSYLSSYEVAAVYVALGDNEQAFQFLERAYEEHCFHLVFLNVWPQFVPIRSDPRFRDLLRRIGLQTDIYK
jgi:serine/threonine protein kinase/Flp pilus assembly protein TadD